MNISDIITDYVRYNNTIKDLTLKYNLSKYNVRKILVENNVSIRTKTNIGVSDLSGKTFGKLKIIRRAEYNELIKKHAGAYWICQCECGKIATLRGSNIVNGSSKSCGCLWKRAKYEQIPGMYLTRLKANAIRRNISYNITPSYLWELFKKQNSKCALSKIDLVFGPKTKQTASVDRINSSIGYEEGNVQWIHKDINQMKMDMPEDIFLNWIFLIASANKK